MGAIEIHDDEINIEDIMRQIRENIRKRKESGTYTKEMEVLINGHLHAPDSTINSEHSKSLQHNLDYINSNWDLHAEYSIRSHRPLFGRILIWGRQLIHGEVRRYVDLIIEKQTEFNAHIAQVLTDSVKGFKSEVNEAVQKKFNETQAVINRDIDNKINESVVAAYKDIENKAWFTNLVDKIVKRSLTKSLVKASIRQSSPVEQEDTIMNYFLFEEKFRGSMEDIKKRQSIFLEYFKNCQNVLDIGCGRGEFLLLLKENGISAKGIDINEDMIFYCRRNGLNVQKIDALYHLESLEDKSLDGVFSGQLIEHLQPWELINIVRLCCSKMKYGAYFIAETVNPLCLSVFASSFYKDLSHVKPIHPETIKFLLESAGFRDIQFKFFSPFPENTKLSKLTITDSVNSEEKARLEVINQNIDKLNSLLYGYQDYAVIAKK